MSAIFYAPNVAQVREWYKWVFSLNHGANPFHPVHGEQHWNVNNTNKDLIWLAGVTATTKPPNQPSQISTVNQAAQEPAVYDDGNGNGVPGQPNIKNPRKIKLDKDDNRNLYIPVCTELASATKWPNLVNSLSQLAQKIIDRDDVNGAPPASVDFEDTQGNSHNLDGNQLKSKFRVNGTIDNLDIPRDDVGMMPTGKGAAAFSDYVVILDNKALKPGINKLGFGVDGKHFSYRVEYEIEKT
jgi:hypothetical protein